MKMKFAIPCIAVLLMLLLKKVSAASYPTINRLGIEQGLSNNTIRCIYQDHDGFIWFGTYDGLNRYDGQGFKVFRNKLNDPASLVHNIVTAVTGDQHHYLWIGTRQGISRYNTVLGKFTSIAYEPVRGQSVRKLEAVIRSVKTDVHNNIWIGTEGQGMLVCRKGIVASPVPLLLNGQQVTNYGIHAIITDSTGQIWALVQNQGLALLDGKTQQLKLVNTTLPAAVCLVTDGKRMYIGSGNAVYEYERSSGKMKKVFDEARGMVLSLLITKDQRELWISTENGNIHTWDRQENKTGLIKAGEGRNELTGGAIHAMYEDNDSRKWIGTLRGGINIIDPLKSRFQTLRREPGNPNTLSGNVISSFYEDADSCLWIGTDGNGLNKWDRHNNTFTAYQHDPANSYSLVDNFITALEGDQQQHIWIATFTKGIQRFDRKTQRFKRYHCVNPATGEENKVVFYLYRDRSDNLWAATLRSTGIYGALYRYNPQKDVFELFDAALSDIFTLNEDRGGVLYGGNLNQLVKIDKTGRQHEFYYIGHSVRAIHEDKNGNCWIGTEGGGLILFDKNKHAVLKRFTTANGLCNDGILNILDDNNGHLWLSTYNGLSKFNISTGTFMNYYQGDGLQSNQFFYNAALMLRSGEMAFGGIKGFSLFTPRQIVSQNNRLNLVLTELMINNSPVENNEAFIRNVSDGGITSIEVPYNKAIFSFSYTALEYSSPRKVSYSYYMEGWDKGWNNAGNTRSATYTHLNEGNYIFRIRCTNAEGNANNREIALHITVLPPWYRSWWAYTLYLACLSGSVYLVFLYKVRQNRLRYEVRLAHMNAQKERDMIEKKLSFFTHISHEFRTPLTLIVNPVKEMLSNAEDGPEKEELGTVFRNARRLLSLVDQLLLFRKAESEEDKLKVVRLDFVELCREVYLCFIHQAKIKKITYTLECPDTPVELYVDREKIEIVLFNLLSNAVKFTPDGGNVIFRLKEEDGQVLVSVSDNGCGIPPETGTQLFRKFYQVKTSRSPARGFGIGLFLAKHFVDSHAGNISYESQVDGGTIFRVALQKGKAHFGQDTVFSDVADVSALVPELPEGPAPGKPQADLGTIVMEQKTILIIDDDEELRKYVSQLFMDSFTILEATNGEDGLRMAEDHLPEVIISDITMQGMSGIEVCRQIRENTALSHIPVILVTASTTSESQLKGIESGADDYITKPFDKEVLKARVLGTLRKRNTLQQYFYNEITLRRNDLKVSVEYKEFLDRCISIVESHLENENFSIAILAKEVGMSHSGLYKKVKSVSGQSVNSFIRYIRLRKAAETMINTEYNIGEIAAMVGFNNIKYFRQHFNELFGMNPSAYIRKFRKPFHNTHQVNMKVYK